MAKDKDPVVIAGMARTPLGSLLGSLSGQSASELGASAIKAALERAQVPADAVDEVIMGCVLPAGQGQAPARQAGRKAGIPDATGAVTINKMCGSGMKAIIQAHDGILAGSFSLAVAGGMESMSNAPYLMPKLRTGNKYGHVTTYDHMALDGLEDAYQPGRSMGTFAEETASAYQIGRAEQDAFAIESLRRAKAATAEGRFKAEIVAVAVKDRGGSRSVDTDEQPGKANPEAIPKLKPAFRTDGTVTAASSSSISDGAAALVVMRQSHAEALGATPIARILAHASHAQEPAWFTTAPINAIRKVLDKAGWKAGDVDLYEINEAFAVVTMVAMRELGLDHGTVNVHGGACALGHPIGASGARIVVTLLNALREQNQERGVASLCIGGGEATALALEIM